MTLTATRTTRRSRRRTRARLCASEKRCTGIFGARTGHRFYNPDTGRWLNRDPIRERGGRNVYAFVVNRPTDYVDRLGMHVFIKFRVTTAHGSVEVNDENHNGTDVISVDPDPGDQSDPDNTVDYNTVPTNYDEQLPYAGLKQSIDNSFSFEARGWSRFRDLGRRYSDIGLSHGTEGKILICACCKSGKVRLKYQAKVGFSTPQSDPQTIIIHGTIGDAQATKTAPDSGLVEKVKTVGPRGCFEMPFTGGMGWRDSGRGGTTYGWVSLSLSATCVGQNTHF